MAHRFHTYLRKQYKPDSGSAFGYRMYENSLAELQITISANQRTALVLLVVGDNSGLLNPQNDTLGQVQTLLKQGFPTERIGSCVRRGYGVKPAQRPTQIFLSGIKFKPPTHPAPEPSPPGYVPWISPPARNRCPSAKIASCAD